MPTVRAQVVKITWSTERVCNGQACETIVSSGSGVVVGNTKDGKLAIITAAHVLKGAGGKTITVSANGRAYPVVGGAVSREEDLALLLIDAKSNQCATLAESVAREATIDVAGFPGEMRLTHRRGLLNRKTKLLIEWTGARPDQGMSGGAVTIDGKLIGIISGYYVDDGRGYGPNCERIRAFLIAQLGYLPTCGDPPEARPPPKPPPPIVVDSKPAIDLSKINAKIAALETRVAELEANLGKLAKRPITVEIYDADDKLVRKRDFPGGTPIKLKLPESDSDVR